MRVVHIFKDFYPPTTGGVEQHVRLLCPGLARYMRVSVLIPSRSPRRMEESLEGVQVIRVPEFGRLLSVPFCPTMPAELRRLAPDLVHLHFPNPMGDLAYLLSGCRAPAVMTYHADILRRRLALQCYRPVFKRLLRHVRLVIVASREYLLTSPFIAPYRERSAVVPFGIDAGAFLLLDGEAEDVARLRRRYGGRLVCFLGVLRPYKGLEVLLQAMTRVAGRLLVVGRGPHGGALQALARDLHLADRVTFLGEVSESQRRLLLHASDVFVLPSTDRSEAFGIAQLEAMACGKPVVSSDLPGVREVNRHGVTGFLVPPGDPDALAQALNRLLDDDELRISLGQAGRERVRREFTADRMIADTLEVYDEVLARSGQDRVPA